MKAEEAVKKWLEENGYDYEVRTYLPGKGADECVKKDKDTISIPADVEDVDGFMGQFVKSFEEINKIAKLKNAPGKPVSFGPEKLAWVNEPAEYTIGSSEIC